MEKSNDLVKIEKDTEIQPRSYQNWQKVRSLMKKLAQNKRKDFKNSHQTPEPHLSKKSKLNLIEKSQRQLSEEQKQVQFMGRVNKIKTKETEIGLIQASDIVQTIYCFQQSRKQGQDKWILKTFRPLPKINYLTSQAIGQNEIDTTGVWVWEAEEVLAYFLISNWKQFSPKGNLMRVLQIGAGCSGLAALAYSRYWQTFPKDKDQKLSIKITDGKKDNIVFLQCNINQNPVPEGVTMDGEHFLWGEEMKEQFQLILAADCLFFQAYHGELVKSLNQLLVDGGIALFVNPRRGKSLDNFLARINSSNQQNFPFSLIPQFLQFQNQSYKSLAMQSKNEAGHNPDTDEFFFLQVRKGPRLVPESPDPFSGKSGKQVGY